jgi:amidase
VRQEPQFCKANLTEFANFVGFTMPSGFSSLGDFSFNPYDPRRGPPDDRPILSPGGSSSGPGIVAAASFAAAAIGTETNGSILDPANRLSLVAIKPTVGLVSRTGIIPLARAWDTAGPLARTVTDAAIVLGAITGADPKDSATLAPDRKAEGDYTQFLDVNALRGARIGIAWGRNAAGNPAYYYNALGAAQRAIVDAAIGVMRTLGADVFMVEIDTAQALSDTQFSSVAPYEFKRDLNAYLGRLPRRFPIRTLSDVIAFNDAYPDQTRFRFGQDILKLSDAFDLDLTRDQYLSDLQESHFLSRTGIDDTLRTYNLDALLFGGVTGGDIGARAGYPSVIVPAGYLSTNGAPYGVTFCGTAWSEPRLIGLAFAFEQATMTRRPPPSTPPLTP